MTLNHACLPIPTPAPIIIIQQVLLIVLENPAMQYDWFKVQN